MRNNILTLLVGFVVLLATVLLVKLGLDSMTDAQAAQSEQFAQFSVDLKRREILYRVQPGDTLWGLADRFYGNGRRWPEIAHANAIKDGEGLVSGSTIKIPLSATGENVPAPKTQDAAASYDEPIAQAPRAGIEDGALGETLCMADKAQFPNGARCLARMGEDLCVSICVYHAKDGAAAGVYAAPRADTLRAMFARDMDGDGVQELFTVWDHAGNANTSRVFRIERGELVLISETPDDPIAVARDRENRK
jgi:nucleoid-associated protein YgaU